jgi:hypothetical protein
MYIRSNISNFEHFGIDFIQKQFVFNISNFFKLMGWYFYLFVVIPWFCYIGNAVVPGTKFA